MYSHVYVLRVPCAIFFIAFIHYFTSFLLLFYLFLVERDCSMCFLCSTGIYAIHLKSGTYKKLNCALIIVCANFTEQQHTISIYIDSFSNTRYKSDERSWFSRNKIQLATLSCNFNMWWWWYLCIHTIYHG